MTVEFLTLAEGSLAYQRQVGAVGEPGVVFLSGFASDMSGVKACFLAERCAAHDIGFVRFDYRGCGQSSGVFAEGTIGAWLQDALAVFDRLTAGPQIIVGSSMGGWLALIMAQKRAASVKALIGIAAAPDFTEELIWKQLTPSQREALLRQRRIQEDDAHAPISLALIEEARDHLVMDKPLPLSCPLRLLQGMKDAEVPWQYALRIAAHVGQDDARVTLIKNGDHRLSRPDDLALLERTVAEFL